jgi:small-conductance mechanosensitive channel
MKDFLDNFMTTHELARFVMTLLVLALGLLIARTLGMMAHRLAERHGTAQHAMVARRTVFFLVLGITLATVLKQLGLDISVLLGAAGVLTVALGFAAQTSASNLISGIFLIFERPFVVGDTIAIGGTQGEVVSVDLLSVKLRTVDNLLVRVPNETLLKVEVTNYTRYAIRRADIDFTVAFRQDLGRLRDLLEAIADEEPQAFDEPRPQFVVRRFSDVGIEVRFSVWTRRESYIEVSTLVQQRMQEVFAREGVELPAVAAVASRQSGSAMKR